MEIDKTVVLILAGIVVCGVIAFGPPAMGDNQAQQTAKVYNTSAVIITNQSGLSENVVTGWNFTGAVSSDVTDPLNVPDGQTQNTTANESVACLNNTNNLAVAITVKAGAFTGTNIVASEGYNISSSDNSKTFGSFAGLTWGENTATGVTIGPNNYRGMYLNITTGENSGEATSTFTVSCEV